MRLKIRIFIFIPLFIFAYKANAQRIKASANLDSTNILIGDQIKLFLEIDHPKNIEIEFPQIPDTLPGNIEVLQQSGIDTFALDEENFQKQIRSYLITSFDSGVYRIPPFWFKINIDGRLDSIPTNGVNLAVHSMPVDTTRGPTDIKMPYDAPLTLKEVTPYILGIILIGAILFFILYSIKRRKNNQPIFTLPKKPKEPAHVIALRELDRIKAQKLWQTGNKKQYYSEVSEVLRKYIEVRYEILAMEQTTDETLESFRKKPDLLKGKPFEYLKLILKLSDLVKFAKYQPLPDDDSITLMNAYFFINDTKIEKTITETSGKQQEKEEGENVDIK